MIKEHGWRPPPSATPNLAMVSFHRLFSPDKPLMRRSASLALVAVFSAWAMALFLSSVACAAAYPHILLLLRQTSDQCTAHDEVMSSARSSSCAGVCKEEGAGGGNWGQGSWLTFMRESSKEATRSLSSFTLARMPVSFLLAPSRRLLASACAARFGATTCSGCASLRWILTQQKTW